MRHFVMASLILAAFACGSTFTAHATGAEDHAEAARRGLVGMPAPRLALKTIDGQAIDLGSLYGKKAVYLKFWATWCVPCIKQMPHFEATFQNAGPDLAVIAINVGFNETLAEIREFRRKHGITMPIVMDDGRFGEAFNLRVTPQHVVIGRDSRIQYVGHFADERLETALVAARTSATTSASVAGARKEAAHYKAGDNVAHLSAVTVDGNTFRAREPAAKRPTVLVFLSPWCESYLATSRPGLSDNCRAVREQVNQLAKGGRARWLGIASGIWASKDDVRDYSKQHNVSIPITLDESGELFRSFRVMNVPTLVIIDAQGRVARRVEGSDEKFAATLEAALAM
jgi:peroxiredoxin